MQLGKGPEMVMNSNDVSSRSGTGMNLNLVGNLKPATEKKSKKNSTRFLDQNIAAITYKVPVFVALSWSICVCGCEFQSLLWYLCLCRC